MCNYFKSAIVLLFLISIILKLYLNRFLLYYK